ncbi:MAG: DUF2121 domain-containing protein [Methanoculleus sp.]
MTLVIAFIGWEGAVMAGDMREITFQGDGSRIEELERETLQWLDRLGW